MKAHKIQLSTIEETPALQPAARKTRRLGEILIEDGVLTADQLHIGLLEQKRSRLRLGEALLRLGFLDQEALVLALAERAGVNAVSPDDFHPDPALLRKLPKGAAVRSLAIPLGLRGWRLEIAMADPFDVVAQDEIRRHFPRGIEIAPRVASRVAIEEMIERHYEAAASVDEILKELETGQGAQGSDLCEHPVIRLVNLLLTDAVKRGASDVHFEPESSFVRVRYRLDGVLHQIRALHLVHWPSLSHRIKIMAGMDIADTRSIQDGRFQMDVGGGTVDFRVAIMPSVRGETIAVRVLDHRRSLVPLEDLGYSLPAMAALEQIASRPHGITLVTGPTGSGKTTTLYALLRNLNRTEVHIATLEDPVEFQLDLIRQTNIQEALGLDFAAGVRGLLRMDPDILLIGEIRDAETAQMALRAAMTGHQVYATLHCNDALGALPRLVDLGLNPRLLAGNLSGLVAQRLVRLLCPACKRHRRATELEAKWLRADPSAPPMIAEAKGCPACNHTGRKGRTVIAEVLPISGALDELVAADAPRGAMTRQARAEGFLTLQEDGVARVLAGQIALTDLRRAVDLSRTEAFRGEA